MKNKFKFLAVILATLMLVSFIPLATFAEEIETEAENTDTDTAEPIEESSSESVEATSEGEISSDTENEETETMVFEFIEPALPGNSRMIGGGGEVGFGPPEGDSDTPPVSTQIIPDGVYAIESVFAPGLWIDVNDMNDPGYKIWQDYYTTSPTESFSRSALFKIRYVQGTNSYIIRLMTNNMLTFGFDELGNLITKTISSPYDDEVEASETFIISRSTNGYTIKRYGDTDGSIACKFDVGGDFYYPDSTLIKSPISEVGNKAKWNFYQYSGTNKSGSTVYYTSSWESKGIPVGTIGTMSNKTWSTYIGANAPYMRVAANSEDMIKTNWDAEVGKMIFNAISPGKATIYSMILEGTSEPSKYTGYMYFEVIPQAGTYFIRNNATEKFIDVEGPSTADGAIIQQWSFSTANQKKWMIEHVPGGEGFVRIKSVYSNKYIAVDSTTSTTIKQTSTLDNYSLWKFERTSSGNLKLICKALSTSLVLAPPSANSGNGVNLTMTTYIDDDNYRDEWTLLENIYFKDLTVFLNETADPIILPEWTKEYLSPSEDYTYSLDSGTSHITVDSTSGKITTKSVGEAIVKATPIGTGVDYTFNVQVVNYAPNIKSLIDYNYITYNDIESTNDGFSMVTKSIADILMGEEIYYIDNNNSINVSTMYDDWYLYSVVDDNGMDYGLIKMREQEDDYIEGVTDNDDAGVSVSFVSFAAETLFYCLDNPSNSNKLNLEQAIDYTTYSCNNNHSSILSGYFSNSKYDGSYIIAREYTKKIASTAINGRIYIIDDMASLINSNSRLSDAITKLNDYANYTLYNTSENYIYIKDTSNLTILEMKAILTTHTANISLYSFAAEITYHAQSADYWKPLLPLSHDIYWCAIRSDMWVGEDNESGFTDWFYYSEHSPYILFQDKFHNEEDYAN